MITYSFNVHTFCNVSNSKYSHKHNSIATNRSSNLLLYKAAVSMHLSVCLSVCTPPPLSTRPSDRNQTFDPPHPGGSRGGPVGFFRVSTNQKSGKCHELPRISIHFLTPLRRWREGGADGRGKGGREGKRGRQGRRGPSEAG